MLPHWDFAKPPTPGMHALHAHTWGIPMFVCEIHDPARFVGKHIQNTHYHLAFRLVWMASRLIDLCCFGRQVSAAERMLNVKQSHDHAIAIRQEVLFVYSYYHSFLQNYLWNCLKGYCGFVVQEPICQCPNI